MNARHFSCSAVLALAWLVRATAGLADSGATLTPDRLSYMVNKDVGSERWTINLNLTPGEPQTFLNASGNIFRADGAPPSFVLCQLRADSTGTLEDPSSIFRFSCTGSGPCQGSALACSQEGWQPIDSDVDVAASFFLPPGGRGLAVQALRAPSASTQQPKADDESRGSTLSSDGYSFLVNKDVGTERWSISLNLVPERNSDGTLETRFSSVTGNVFMPDGSPPSFIYCTERSDSLGTLAKKDTEFRLSCLGATGCMTTASECAATAWEPIADVDLAASFFLPPGGLPDSTSDSEIVIIGRTSDPPSIISREYRLVEAGTAAGDRPLGTSCPVGNACVVPTLGGCTDTPGVVVEVDFCGCQVTDVPSECITCGSGANGTCGGACDFPVGSREARGFCLPFAAGSTDCLCYAVPAGGEPTVPGCGGTVGASCPGDRCCADDPRDGCEASSGGLDCAGVCVAADSCDRQAQQCGICPPPPTVTPTPRPSVTINPTETPTPCGNGTIDLPEQCDGGDFGGDSCAARGFCGGELTCTAACEIDTGSCVASGGLPDGATCATSACCTSGVCSATLDAPDSRRCIACPKLKDECSEASCCDQFGQLECQAAAGSSFCCVGSGFSCAGADECCSGTCLAGICQ